MTRIDASYLGLQRDGPNRFGIGMNEALDSMMGGKPILYAVEASDQSIRGDFWTGAELKNMAALPRGIQKLMAAPEEQ